MILEQSVSGGEIERLSREERRAGGIYYTPYAIAREMAAWAIDHPATPVLDPSFGGGVFLRVASDRLRQLGAASPLEYVFGVDRDARARRCAEGQDGLALGDGQLRIADFLTVRPRDFPVRFAAVLGNPPYIRHHNIATESLAEAGLAMEEVGAKLSRKASYWAYFVLHAMRFVAPKGRLALVLPGMLLHAHYAREVRNALRAGFDRVTAILVDERVFPDAQEESVVLLADGRRSDADAEVRVGSASSTNISLCRKGLEGWTRALTVEERNGSWLRGVLSARELDLYDGATSLVPRLGEEAKIRLGSVTGHNRFFVLSRSELTRLGIPESETRPIITHASQLEGLELESADVREMLDAGVRALLLYPSDADEPHPSVRAYLEAGELDGIPARHKCSTRRPWYIVPSVEPPDAYLLYMAGLSPRLTLNTAEASCTNTIHALTWRRRDGSSRPRAIALASLTTLAQLSAEIEGRSYGGGVLKLEPSEAARLSMPLGPVDNLDADFIRAERLCRAGRRETAISLADDALLRRFLHADDVDTLRSMLVKLRLRRLGRGKSIARSSPVTSSPCSL